MSKMPVFKKDLNKMAAEIHAANVEKGFWDKPRNLGSVIFLIICEMAEAVEAERNGADIQKEEEGAKVANECLIKGDKDGFFTVYQDFVRGGIAEEIVDACIRILDLFGHYNKEISKAGGVDLFIDEFLFTNDKQDDSPFDLSKEMVFPTKFLTSCYGEEQSLWHLEVNLCEAFSRLCWIASQLGIDLPLHIELKLAYNAQRPRMHGKKY